MTYVLKAASRLMQSDSLAVDSVNPGGVDDLSAQEIDALSRQFKFRIVFTVDGSRPASVERAVTGTDAKDAWSQICNSVFRSSMYGEVTSVQLLNP